MNKAEIMQCIPHRKDMLILDEVTYLDEKSARGKYLIKGTEFFLNEHYPKKKIVPGTTLCEIMAQLLAVYCSQRSKGLPVLVEISNASFKKMVQPKDNLNVSIDIIKASARLIKAHGKIHLNEDLCACADFTVASLFDKDFMN